MKFTIITVSYNSEKTIEETFKSILSQDYANFEYIVIDGVSKDKTLDIIRKFENDFDKRGINFHYISESDSGIFDAMNKGIQLAKGEWIGIINSDDYYFPNTLSAIEQSFIKNPTAEVIYGDIDFLNPNGNKTRLTPSSLDKFYYKMSIFHPSTFVKKEIYQKFGLFSLKYRLSSDWELLLRFFHNNCNFVYTNEVLSVFRTDGAGSSFKYKQLKEKKSIRHIYKVNAWTYLYDLYDWYVYLKHRIKK